MSTQSYVTRDWCCQLASSHSCALRLPLLYASQTLYLKRRSTCKKVHDVSRNAHLNYERHMSGHVFPALLFPAAASVISTAVPHMNCTLSHGCHAPSLLYQHHHYQCCHALNTELMRGDRCKHSTVSIHQRSSFVCRSRTIL